MRRLRSIPAIGLLLFLAAPLAAGRQIQLGDTQKLSPTNPVGADHHGQALALEGDVLLVGTPAATTTGSGIVYAYARSGGSWNLQQKFSFTLASQGASFGRRIALDGATAVVAILGSAFVYQFNGATWGLQQTIASPTSNQFYGTSVAVHADTALVGQSTMTESQAWVWVRSGTQWSLQQKLEPPNPPQAIGFGQAVAVIDDTAVIGAPLDPQGGMNAGAIYVFTRSGVTWTQQAKLVGSPPTPNYRLGGVLDLQLRPSGNFEILAGAGAATSRELVLFEGSGASWTQTARVLPETGGPESGFGNAVRISGDLLVTGAWRGDGSALDSGLASVYRRCGDGWVRQADLIGSDTVSNDNLGLAVAIDGETLVVGAPSHDVTIQDGGATYVFDLASSPLALFCHGDGSGAPCPCNNELPPGESGGCVNSTGVGAELVLDDSIQVSIDDLRAHACGLVPGQQALLFAGQARVAGGSGISFGDGLRCADTAVVRLGTLIADSSGAAIFGPGLNASGGWTAGDTRHFQVWYRDPSGSPCGSGFNLSNGASATFAP